MKTDHLVSLCGGRRITGSPTAMVSTWMKPRLCFKLFMSMGKYIMKQQIIILYWIIPLFYFGVTCCLGGKNNEAWHLGENYSSRGAIAGKIYIVQDAGFDTVQVNLYRQGSNSPLCSLIQEREESGSFVFLNLNPDNYKIKAFTRPKSSLYSFNTINEIVVTTDSISVIGTEISALGTSVFPETEFPIQDNRWNVSWKPTGYRLLLNKNNLNEYVTRVFCGEARK